MSSVITPNRRLIGTAIALTLSLVIPILRADPLHDAVAALEAPDRGDSHAHAFRQLAQLDTPESLHEIVRHFSKLWNPTDDAIEKALTQSKHLPIVLKDMEQLLADPDTPITYAYLSFLMSRSFQVQHPPSLKSGAIQPFSTEDQAERQKEIHNLRDSNWTLLQKADRAWPLKREPLRTNMVLALYNTLENAGPNVVIVNLPYTKPELVAMRHRLGEELAPHLPQLPTDTVLTLLQNHRTTFLRPELLPTLLSLYKDSGGAGDRPPKPLHSFLLLAIHALAPEDARQLLLRDLRSGIARCDAKALEILPPEQAPPMDDIILRFLAGEDSSLATALLNRYGTPKLAPQIREIYLPKFSRYAWEAEAGCLAYLLRVDPEGAPVDVDRALQSCEFGSQRYRSLLSNLVHRAGAGLPPFLRRLLIQQLNHPDLNQARDAAAYLGDCSAPEAKAALWQRLERFHHEYGSHPEKLAKGPADTYESPAMSLESLLVYELSHSPHWLLNKTELEHMAGLCVSSHQKVTTLLSISQNWGGPTPIRVTPGANENWPSLDPSTVGVSSGGVLQRITGDTWRVGDNFSFTREDMLRKIAQYPPHTVFAFQFCGRIAAKDEQATFEALKKDLVPMTMDLIQWPEWQP